MNTAIFLIILGAMLFFPLWLCKTSKETKSQEDFFLMGRRLPFLGLSLTMLATQLGGGALMGAADEAYTRGWGVLFYPLGMVLGLLILGLGFGARLRSFKLTTVPEIFEKIYQSKKLRQVAALLSILSLFFILVAQGIAAKKLFIAIGFDSFLLFILFWSVLISYTVFGGLRAVVKTDILQILFILSSFLMIACALFFGEGRSYTLSDKAPLIEGHLPWITWFLMPLLFMLIEQDMGQRCFAAKTPKTVSSAAFTAGIILLLTTLLPIYLGRRAGLMNLPLPAGGSVLIASVGSLLGPVLSSFLMAAILMAILSTADSLLCSISSNLVCDFPLFQHSESLASSRVMTLIVGLSALVMVFLFKDVVPMLMFSYELSVSVLAIPIIMGVVRKKGERKAAIASMISGALSFILFKFVTPPLPKEVLTLLFSACGFCLFFFIGEMGKNGMKQIVKAENKHSHD